MELLTFLVSIVLYICPVIQCVIQLDPSFVGMLPIIVDCWAVSTVPIRVSLSVLAGHRVDKDCG